MSVMVIFSKPLDHDEFPVEFGPFEDAALDYDRLQVGYDGQKHALAYCTTSGGLWCVTLSQKLKGAYGEQHNGSEWTDVTIRSM